MTSLLDPVVSTAGPELVVTVAGSPLPDTVAFNLVEAQAESNMHRPDSFFIKFIDNDQKVIEEAGLQLATPVALKVSQGEAELSLVSGEITAMELEVTSLGRYVVIRGHDQSHRLFAGTHTKAFLKMTASDIVQQIAADSGMTVGTIDATNKVYDEMTQADTTDWAFIKYLSFLEGRDAYCSDGAFHFTKLASAKEGPDPATDYDRPQGTQLVFGHNVLRLHGVITATEQVGTVETRGWDPETAQAIVGTGTSSAVSGYSHDTKANAEEVAGQFGSPTRVFTDIPFDDQSSADVAAVSLAEQIAGSMSEFEGECLGNASIFAGAIASLGLAGDPFDGQYVVTSARHEFDGTRGYRTWFRMGGRRDRSLLSLVDGSRDSSSPIPSIPGVVIGQVTSVKDPENKSRVQVQFPWLDDNYVSDWVRVVQVSASGGYGSFVLPEPGDEVLVAFDHGNPSYPYVLGALYNGQHTPSHKLTADVDAIDSSSGAVNVRGIVSRLNHMLLFEDGHQAAQQGIKLLTGDSNCSLIMAVADSENEPNVTIDSKGNVTVTAAKDVSITATGKMTLQATEDLTLSGGSVSITANNEQLKLTGTAGVSVSGAQIKLGG